ncbi:MAG: hypothetical protein AB9900_01505 [Humidesulfovibrio sp.]
MAHRILVVDDDADVRDMVCRALTASGDEAIPAAGGRQAVEQALNPLNTNPTKEIACPRR